MLSAKLAVLLHLKPVGIIFLVFLGAIVAALAFHTSKCNFNSHYFGTSCKNSRSTGESASLPLYLKTATGPVPFKKGAKK